MLLLLAMACPTDGPFEDCQECCDEKMHEGVARFVADEPDALERVQANDECRRECVEDVEHCVTEPEQ